MKTRSLVSTLCCAIATIGCGQPERNPMSNSVAALQYSASSSWHVAIETMDMITNCNSQTDIPVGGATDCAGAIVAAQNLFNPAIMNCLLPGCKSGLEAANPGLVLNLADVSIVPGTATCWVDPYTTPTGASRTRYQVSTPFECTACTSNAVQGWSSWLNRDNPGGNGDYETIVDFKKACKMPCNNPHKIQCRFVGSPNPFPPGNPPTGYTCNKAVGGACTNQPGFQCQDIEVRFLCLNQVLK